ncbi:16S rRNA (cytosine(1402)-N(4))-methyltransferase RsmH [Robiginitomaculum antarcticum]|uniref:16S rRNA (cytosine(1402)-N(4))-methyltransferase RsmH n=1 Tax=Robiginitomaculum antarcticum TaxID=437507 RepID=UPI000374CD08|nr:16S rRNA (cytosine(1402)-N(4))-methyltransferase RsmH [Robiginitomaculum antarcticum]
MSAARPHYPVMLPEVMHALSPKSGELFIDGTFGNGGYSRAILECDGAYVIAIDRDPNVAATVAAMSEEFGERFTFYNGAFSDMSEAAQGRAVDGIVLDIGVSSMQIDQAIRGFSFQKDGPLDMRMAQDGPDAADAIAHLSHSDLIQIFRVYGEERRAKRCADFIMRAREEAPITTTAQLADLMAQALGKSGKINPATRVFQALRIFINDELGELYRALIAAEALLTPGGRLVVVSFHSLEDRIVKSFLRRRAGETQGQSRYMPESADTSPAPSFILPHRSALTASKSELSENVRSRSAKLRSAVRTDAPEWPTEGETLLPRAPSLAMLGKVA